MVCVCFVLLFLRVSILLLVLLLLYRVLPYYARQVWSLLLKVVFYTYSILYECFWE